MSLPRGNILSRSLIQGKFVMSIKRWFRSEKRFNRRCDRLICTWRMQQGRVSQVALRTSTSILVLSVLVAGILSPSGLCAFVCQRHTRAESPRPCSHASDSMSGMMHQHTAAITAPDLGALNRSCASTCDAVALLDLSRKPAAHVTTGQSYFLVSHSTSRVPDPEIATVLGSPGGPPGLRKAMPACSVLRI